LITCIFFRRHPTIDDKIATDNNNDDSKNTTADYNFSETYDKSSHDHFSGSGYKKFSGVDNNTQIGTLISIDTKLQKKNPPQLSWRLINFQIETLDKDLQSCQNQLSNQIKCE